MHTYTQMLPCSVPPSPPQYAYYGFAGGMCQHYVVCPAPRGPDVAASPGRSYSPPRQDCGVRSYMILHVRQFAAVQGVIFITNLVVHQSSDDVTRSL